MNLVLHSNGIYAKLLPLTLVTPCKSHITGSNHSIPALTKKALNIKNGNLDGDSFSRFNADNQGNTVQSSHTHAHFLRVVPCQICMKILTLLEMSNSVQLTFILSYTFSKGTSMQNLRDNSSSSKER